MIKTPPKRAASAYHEELTRAFLARRCSVCGAQATVIAVRPGAPDLNYCLPCSPSLVQPALVEPEAGQPPGVRSVDRSIA